MMLPPWAQVPRLLPHDPTRNAGLFLDRLRLNGLIRAEGRIGMKLVRRGVEFKLNHAKDIRFSKFSESLIVLSCLILSLVVFCHAFVKSSYHIMPCHFMYCKK